MNDSHFLDQLFSVVRFNDSKSKGFLRELRVQERSRSGMMLDEGGIGNWRCFFKTDTETDRQTDRMTNWRLFFL